MISESELDARLSAVETSLARHSDRLDTIAATLETLTVALTGGSLLTQRAS